MGARSLAARHACQYAPVAMDAAAAKRTIYVTVASAGRAAGVGPLRGLPDRPGTLRVLMYHKITAARPNSIAVTPAAFEDQQAFLADQYVVVSLGDVERFLYLGKPLPSRAVLLTFDDGYLDNLATAYPILKRYEHRAVLFVATAFLGRQALPHDRHLPSPNPTADWHELLDVLDVFEIGSHGRSHEPFSRLTHEAAQEEAVRSKEEIEARLGVTVRAFAYPKGSIGDFRRGHAQVLRAAGYRLAFTTLPGLNTVKTNPFRIKRHNVEDYGPRYFESLLDGSADILALKDTRAGYHAKRLARRVAGIRS